MTIPASVRASWRGLRKGPSSPKKSPPILSRLKTKGHETSLLCQPVRAFYRRYNLHSSLVHVPAVFQQTGEILPGRHLHFGVGSRSGYNHRVHGAIRPFLRLGRGRHSGCWRSLGGGRHGRRRGPYRSGPIAFRRYRHRTCVLRRAVTLGRGSRILGRGARRVGLGSTDSLGRLPVLWRVRSHGPVIDWFLFHLRPRVARALRGWPIRACAGRVPGRIAAIVEFGRLRNAVREILRHAALRHAKYKPQCE